MKKINQLYSISLINSALGNEIYYPTPDGKLDKSDDNINIGLAVFIGIFTEDNEFINKIEKLNEINSLLFNQARVLINTSFGGIKTRILRKGDYKKIKKQKMKVQDLFK